MNARWLTRLGAAAVLAVATASHGQDAASSPFFDCPYVNYFDNDCPQLRELWEKREQRRPLGREDAFPVPAGQAPDAPERQSAEGEDGPSVPDAGETYLLFPRESLAPDAPPLFRRLLAKPTIDNARRYVHWYSRRATRLQAVQALIRIAGGELESDRKQGEQDELSRIERTR